MNKPSGIARGLSAANTIHRLVFGLMAAAAVVATLRSAQSEILDRAADGGVAMMGVLAAWALGRELAPDLQAPGILAAVAAVGLAAIHTNQHTDVMATFCIVLAARIVARTTGARAGWADPLIVAGAVALAADNAAGAVAAGAMIVAWPLQEYLPDLERPAKRLLPILCGASGMLSVGVIGAMAWPLPGGVEPPRWIALVAASITGGVILTAFQKTPRTRCDRDRRPLRSLDLRVTAALVTITLIAALAATGTPAVPALAPAWIALAASGLFSGTAMLAGRAKDPSFTMLR